MAGFLVVSCPVPREKSLRRCCGGERPYGEEERKRLTVMSLGSDVVDEAARSLRGLFEEIDDGVEHNLGRVLDAYRKHRVGNHHFSGNNGYGHGDEGREILDAAYATIFGCEDALVRVQFFSGTHAITAALFAGLRPGDELLSAVGEPYDTLEEVIGIRGNSPGSLKDYGITYREHSLLPNGRPDLVGLVGAIRPETKVRTTFYHRRREANTHIISKFLCNRRPTDIFPFPVLSSSLLRVFFAPQFLLATGMDRWY